MNTFHTSGNGNGFVPNKGQITDMNNIPRPDLLYVAETSGMQVYLRQGGFSYVLKEFKVKDENTDAEKARLNIPFSNDALPEDIFVQRIDVDILNCNVNALYTEGDRAAGYINYYLPHCGDGILNVPSFSKIIYQDIYPHIDIVFYANGESGFKYDFIVRPGGDPRDIKLKYQGANSLEIFNSELLVNCAVTTISEQIPKVYQNINGKIYDVACKYSLDGELVGFDIEPYQKNVSLVIDPWVTYFGGSGEEKASSINKDAAGNIILTGYSASIGFPTTAGAYQTTMSGVRDVVISKFSTAGALLWSTYYGGSLNEDAAGIASDAAGNIFVTGNTYSNNFPMLNPGGGAYFDNTYSNLGEVFILKFNNAGTRQWATYIGDAGVDYGRDVACDNNGNVILVGLTSSGTFPSAGGFQTVKSAGVDGFVTKFNNLGVLQWSTFYGGSGTDYANGVAINSTNDIYVTGDTQSNNFPTNSMAGTAYFDNTLGGTSDAFVFQLTTAGAQVWSTYLGGSGSEWGYCIAVHSSSGIISVGGMTFSSNFPTTTGVFQQVYGGGNYDSYVTVFNNNNTMKWSSFLGGNNRDYATGLDYSPMADIVVVGDTYSPDFPVTSCAYQTSYIGSEDQYFAVISNDGRKRKCSSLLGIGTISSQNNETSEGLGGSGVVIGCNVYIAAHSVCTYPVTAGAYQTNCSSFQYEMALSQMYLETCGSITPNNFSFTGTTSICAGQSALYTPTITMCDTSIASYLWTFTGGSPSTSTVKNPSGIIYSTPGSYNVKLVVTTPCKKDSLVRTNYITVTPCSFTVSSAGQSICPGKCATVSANAAGGITPYTYNWFSPLGAGPSGQTVSLCPTQTTTYTVQVTDSLGSISTSTLTITVLNGPSPSVLGNTSICPGSSTMLTATGGGTYSWSTGSTNAVINVNPTVPTTYTLTVILGSCDSTITHTVGIASPPSAFINGPAFVCLGAGTVLTAGGGNSYSWSTGSTANVISVNPTSATTYTLTSYSGTCVATASHTVSVVNPPNAVITGNDSVCPGNNAVLTASGGGNYSWSTGATTSIIAVTPSSGTTYTLTVDSAGCSTVIFYAVHLYPLLNPVINGPNIICYGDSAILTAAGGTGYVWNTGVSAQTITVNPTNNTSYFVTATDAHGCVNTTLINITVISNPIAYAGPDDTICPGESAFLNATGGGDYLWSTGNTSSSISVSPPSASIYSVTVSVGNCKTSDTVSITVSTNPIVDISGDTTIIAGQVSVLTASASASGSTYLWNTGETTSVITVTPTASSVYIVTVTDENGCISSDTITVTIVKCDNDVQVLVPNSFSPNGDGQNDLLKLYSNGFVESLYFAIYNRWGEKVFETGNVNETWDGTFRNKPMDTAVYTWILKTSCGTDVEELIHKGNISLIR